MATNHEAQNPPTLSRWVIGGFMVGAIVYAVIELANGEIGGSVVTAAIWVAIGGWWFHLWGVSGPPPPGARNRLPFQER